ncbi:MAG TPA: hypothetical protein VE863_19610 [Pyrinomonadaceae bacterium]|jgi:hypothetical protein|nr:hypothetical protein [Pyrinomonadaceae bacterium]
MATTSQAANKVEQLRPDISTNSFIVKVWVEPNGQPGEQMVWRGHITHVPDGKRKHVRRMKEITEFITSYLQNMGVNDTIWERIRNRLWH